jgi:opacity protein-like surface antigen
MKKALRWAVAVAVMTVLGPSVASAENFYAAIRGGPGLTPDNESGPVGFEDKTEFKTGFTGGAAVGYSFPIGLRVEGELGFMWVPLKREGGVEVDGSVKNYLVMANAYYDLKLAALGPFRPYIGFGIGGARVNEDHEIFAGSLGAKVEIDEWRTAFAYQGRVGVIYDVNQWLDLSAGYRYLHVDGGHYERGPARINVGGMNNHSFELGFAVKF